MQFTKIPKFLICVLIESYNAYALYLFVNCYQNRRWFNRTTSFIVGGPLAYSSQQNCNTYTCRSNAMAQVLPGVNTP